MNPRFKALKEIQRRSQDTSSPQKEIVFGQETFHRSLMEKLLPGTVSSNLKEAIEGRAKFNPTFAQAVADALREWATSQGATHFCHWFHPLTGHSAEKHDAFIDWNRKGELIEKFSGSHLMRGEPDASSFPHGGLRSTAEARGYTVWDPTVPPFLWGMGSTKVLCIPSIFFSWTGRALDTKIPLMRSCAKLNAAAVRLLNLLEIKASSVHPTLGCEQEYFLVDRAYYLLRPDLMLTGRTLCGGIPARGQELEDHYFSALKERVCAFTCDVQQRAMALGIPLRTRHAEVAPGQFEFAPIFESISTAVDHNILLMEIMRQVASRHHLACLLHEKPFAQVNGSGKHCNWSLSTDTGINLLDPNQPELPFLTMLTAVIHAVHQHAALLRASIATPGNDHRLGGHEAPPPIISVYLGDALHRWVRSIQENKAHESRAGEMLNLGIPPIPDVPLDETDRNRTSPFAFTGNKFEFRAVGSSQNCAEPITVLNVIVAESLNQIVDEIEKEVAKKQPLKEAVLKSARKFLKSASPILFTGDNYSSSWHREAKKRKLPIIPRSADAFHLLTAPKTVRLFEGVLSKHELESRFEIACARYCTTVDIEARLLLEMFHTQILPVALQYQKEVAESIEVVSRIGCALASSQTALIAKLSRQISQAIEHAHALDKERKKVGQMGLEKRLTGFKEGISEQMTLLRKSIDELESVVDDRLWTLPKYREMLHIL